MGMRVRPRAVVEVRNASGESVYREHIEKEQILPEPVAYQMVTMLQDVVERGTGSAARKLGVRGAIAGKTGTTNDYHDAWFVGFSPSVVVGVWAGFDQPERIASGASGSRIALPIWADFMRRTARRIPAGDFVPPSGLRTEELCRVSYLRPVEGCPTYLEYFKGGDDIPTHLCPVHQGDLKQRVQRAVQGVFSAIGRGIRGIFR
jgi:membrane carboxypeptidase/penicillin-binding protein